MRVEIRGRGAKGYQKSRVVHHAYGPTEPMVQRVGSSLSVKCPKMDLVGLQRVQKASYRGP